MMGLNEHAIQQFRAATEFANEIGSRGASCVAVGNLGMSSFMQQDTETARMCLQYHRNMVRQLAKESEGPVASVLQQLALGDVEKNLGLLCVQEGKLEDAAQQYDFVLIIFRTTIFVRVEQCLYTSIVPGIEFPTRGTMLVYKHCSTRSILYAWNSA